MWISALEIPEEAAEALNGLMEVKVFDLTLLEAVGHVFGADVGPYMPFLNRERGMGNWERIPRAKRAAQAVARGVGTAEIKAYFTLIDAAQFYYRNYQDEALYATIARYLASGVKPCAWEPSVRAAVEHYDRYGGRELVGKSREITTLQERINRVAAHEHARVLILGESGTGKETVAQQIHTKSPRWNMPFVSFNCASVTKDLLE
ncbi:MAG: sigma 54-interacting transcriptional regulator, partial [Kiritimatiellae bacterium]|nr:sigma 54-interacting transcriptional regulator [Kiritimatiellia bacterium]